MIFLWFTDSILKLDNNRCESFYFNMYLSSTTMFSKVIMSFFAPRENSFTLYPFVRHNSMFCWNILSHKRYFYVCTYFVAMVSSGSFKLSIVSKVYHYTLSITIFFKENIKSIFSLFSGII